MAMENSCNDISDGDFWWWVLNINNVSASQLRRAVEVNFDEQFQNVEKQKKKKKIALFMRKIWNKWMLSLK